MVRIAKFEGTAVTFTRIGGLAALGFAALIVSNVMFLASAGMPVPGAEAGETVAFFNTKGDVLAIASTFVPLTWVLLTLFGAGAVALLRHSERDRGEAWSLLGFAGLVSQNGAFAAIAAIRLALASTTTHDSAATTGLWALHDALFTLNGTFLAIALIGLSVSGRRANLIRPWHGRLGLLSAALMFTSATITPLVIDHTGPLALIGLLGWLMWVGWIATYGITLIRLPPAQQPQPITAR